VQLIGAIGELHAPAHGTRRRVVELDAAVFGRDREVAGAVGFDVEQVRRRLRNEIEDRLALPADDTHVRLLAVPHRLDEHDVVAVRAEHVAALA
jgi:hypothetical protein